MTNFSVRTAISIFIRVFIVVLTFTFDVKVRADVVIKEVAGRVEIEKNGAVTTPTAAQIFEEPLDVETFARGTLKVQVNSIYMGLGERTLAGCAAQPRCDVSWGTAFFIAPMKDHVWFRVRTPQGEVVTQGGEFLVEVHNNKTMLSMISGKAELKDRASGQVQRLRPGYSTWLGGLLAKGYRAKGRLAAVEFADVMMKVQRLSVFSADELQTRQDHLHIAWKDAIEEVSRETQDQVAGDLQILGEIQEAEHKRQTYEQRRAAHRARHLRAKAFDLPDEPDENTAGPSGSARVPASSAE